jgi:hypothetical protein
MRCSWRWPRLGSNPRPRLGCADRTRLERSAGRRRSPRRVKLDSRLRDRAWPRRSPSRHPVSRSSHGGRGFSFRRFAADSDMSGSEGRRSRRGVTDHSNSAIYEICRHIPELACCSFPPRCRQAAETSSSWASDATASLRMEIALKEPPMCCFSCSCEPDAKAGCQSRRVKRCAYRSSRASLSERHRKPVW